MGGLATHQPSPDSANSPTELSPAVARRAAGQAAPARAGLVDGLVRQLVRPDVDLRAALVTLMDARGALYQLRVGFILSPVRSSHVRGGLPRRGWRRTGNAVHAAMLALCPLNPCSDKRSGRYVQAETVTRCGLCIVEAMQQLVIAPKTYT